jgi:hypothetical protein
LRWKSTTAFASSFITVSVPAAPMSMRNPMTSSSLRRAVVPSSSVISASQSRLVSAPLGWSRWSATNADQ